MIWLLACAPRPPDIVLVVVDTLRADHLSLYGHGNPTSPKIDALAKSGGHFTRAYSHSGWTLPSFASLFTGLYPHEHGVVRDAAANARFGRLDDAVETLAEKLQARGYRTGAFVNNTFLAPEFNLQQGFDRWDWVAASHDRHRSAHDTVTAALAWKAEQSGPSFTLVHFMEPHLGYRPTAPARGRFAKIGGEPFELPFDPPTATRRAWANGDAPMPDGRDRRYIRDLYDEEILLVDYAVGELVAGLDLEKTAVLLTADHGEELWDRGGYEHGHSLHDELTRVPLVVAGRVPVKGEQEGVVDHRMLFGGILALAGAPGPSLWDTPGPGWTVAENCLYGEDRKSVV